MVTLLRHTFSISKKVESRKGLCVTLSVAFSSAWPDVFACDGPQTRSTWNLIRIKLFIIDDIGPHNTLRLHTLTFFCFFCLRFLSFSLFRFFLRDFSSLLELLSLLELSRRCRFFASFLTASKCWRSCSSIFEFLKFCTGSIL